ncbi:hypothetical protein CC80DRAFT_286772 [Byssothecium circinans]|uniref:Beta-xylosidase C-terminal Concanavalin A-like domain-containing protein n=1 Tax=Byssothecium circinans TaxID=147558 RepID=A0A6A5UGD7_9PLEO|nr:hypothetical protein CC80DRAFT_286772 [Byssothecium circinans]
MDAYENPIVPGFAPDPSVVFADGIFYLTTSSFHVFPGLPLYASDDLKSWKLIGHALNRLNQLPLENATTTHVTLDTGHAMAGTSGLYAPTIRHHNGRFYIVCTNIIAYPDGKRKSDNFVISTRDIWAGDWSDPVYFPFKGIDPDLFFDDDDDGGRAYVQGSWRLDRVKQPRCTIMQYEIDIATGTPLEEPRVIWGGVAKYDTEAPHIYKKDGWYYLLVAEGGTFEHHMLSMARSRSVRGPYEAAPVNPVLTADGKDEYVQNVGHGDLFTDEGGRWWAVVLGVRNVPGWPLGRESFLTKVEWGEGGWPRFEQVRMKFERVKGLGLSTAEAGHGKSASLANRVSKSATTLPGVSADKTTTSPTTDPRTLEFIYIRNANLDKYRFNPSEPSTVWLYPTASGLSSPRGSMTFIGMRQRSLSCTAKATFDLADLESTKSDISIGFALYKDHLRHASISFAVKTGDLTFGAVNATQTFSRRTSVSIGAVVGKLRFLIHASAESYVFKYQCGNDEGEFVEVGTVAVTELFARDFKGPIFGVFATSEGGEGEWVGVREFGVEGL